MIAPRSPVDLPGSAIDASSERGPRHALPTSLSSFVGRSGDILSVRGLLEREDASLVTLTGPGGIGKTRLALEVARQHSPLFEDRITFVPLASIHDPGDVMPAIATGLGLLDTHSQPLIPRISRSLPDASMLLILDNMEQVVDAAPEIAKLLEANPQLRILATSRAPLHIRGEREYAVPQLDIPDLSGAGSTTELTATESVALFLERAQAVNHAFEIDDDNAGSIAEICVRLDGLPLAIELAAARVKVLPPAALLERLENRLEILRSAARDVPPRLRTMRSAIDWSYDLLEPAEQFVFRSLSVFRTGFTLGIAEEAFDGLELDTLEHISSLVDKSLIAPRSNMDGEPAYRMMEVIRQYGLQQLEVQGERPSAERRHAETLARTVDRARATFFGPDQRTWIALFRCHHDDLRAALDWTENTGDQVIAARLASVLWKFWWMDSHVSEGRQRLTAVLAHERDVPADLLGDLYFGASVLAWGQYDMDAARRLFEKLERVASESGDQTTLALSHYIAGMGNLVDTPDERLSRSLAIWEEQRDEAWISLTLEELGVCALQRGDIDRAIRLAEASLDSAQSCDHPWGIGATRAGLARALREAGRDHEAAEHFKESLHLFVDLGAHGMTPSVVDHLAGLSVNAGQHHRAARLFGYTARARETMAFPPRTVDLDAHNDAVQTARASLGEEAFDAAWRSGQKLSLAQAIEEALNVEATKPVKATPARDSDVAQSPLTRREHDVLQRIVTGKTDQEIADELFVSYRTVTTHVTNILNKLGVNSRTEAAAVAVRAGYV